MAFKDMSNPFKYRTHYDAKIKSFYSPLSKQITIVQPEDGGRIGVVYNGKTYYESFSVQQHETVTVRVYTNDGYTLNSFTMDGETIADKTEVQIETEITLEASFTKKSFLIKIPTNPITGGTIKVTHNGTVETTSFYAEYGDDIQLYVELENGYKFSKITLVEGSSTLTFKQNDTHTVRNTCTITATTTIINYTVSIAQPTNGKITVVYNNKNYTSTFTAHYGDKITIKATANTGYTIGRIVFNNTGVDNNTTQTITKDSTITTTPNKIQYIVSITQPTNGTITAVYNGKNYTKSFNVSYGDQVSFTCVVSDSSKYYIRGFYKDGVSVTQNQKYTISSNVYITADIAAVVVTETVTIKITQPTGATIYASYNQQLYTSTFTAVKGYPVTVYIIAEDAYNITQFRINSTDLPIEDRYEFNANMTYVITATTQLKKYLVTINQVNGGTITVNYKNTNYTTNLEVTWGDSIKITATPDTAYNLTSVTKNGSKITSGSSYVIKEDSVITASYSIKRFNVYVTQPSNGKILVNNTYDTQFTFTYGTQITVSATADEGYKVTALYKEDL